jgi:hypothetical protein
VILEEDCVGEKEQDLGSVSEINIFVTNDQLSTNATTEFLSMYGSSFCRRL